MSLGNVVYFGAKPAPSLTSSRRYMDIIGCVRSVLTQSGGIYQLYNPVADMFLQMERSIAEEDHSAVRCSLMERSRRTKNPWCETRVQLVQASAAATAAALW